MADTNVQDLRDDMKNAKPIENRQRKEESVSEKNRIRPEAAVSISKMSKVGVTFVILSLCGMLVLAGLWIAEWQEHKKIAQKQADDIRAEIVDLRGLVDASITEDIIRLKIHVLDRRVSNETAQEIASAVYKYASLYKREPDLILAIMKVESSFAPAIESHMGAIGLMQVMPQWIDVLGIECNLKNPDCNTKYGLQILGAYEHLYGSLEMALTAFNRGPGPVDSALMRGKSPDNGYADKVWTVYKRLRELNR